MRFQVPQFIDIEDKIFGPLTFKQFVYLAGGGGLAFLIYKSVPFMLALPLMLAVIGLGGSLAFVRINNKPFVEVIQAYIKYFFQNKLYIWKRKKALPEEKAKLNMTVEERKTPIPRMTESKLSELSWGLDVKDEQETKYTGK